jgi:hypothetical protein
MEFLWIIIPKNTLFMFEHFTVMASDRYHCPIAKGFCLGRMTHDSGTIEEKIELSLPIS